MPTYGWICVSVVVQPAGSGIGIFVGRSGVDLESLLTFSDILDKVVLFDLGWLFVWSISIASVCSSVFNLEKN